ncbi:MAG: hypothetical protein RR415_12935 [Ruthenibacterium sp.]
MDKKKRGCLKDAMNMLSNAAAIVGSVCDNEQDCVDNYPENLQGTDTFEHMEEAVDSLNDALERIDDAKSQIQYAIG